MGYRIDYDSSGGSVRVSRSQRGQAMKRFLLCLVGVFCAVGLLVPSVRIGIRDILLPGDEEVTSRALHGLVTDLKNGDPISEAVETFCKEILYYG